MKDRMPKEYHENTSELFKNLDDMERSIFGKKICERRPVSGFGTRSNDNRDFNLNFTPEFERIHDSSQMFEDSIGAEDSPMVFFEQEDRCRRNTFAIMPHSNRSLVRPNEKKQAPKKSCFINDSRFKKNFTKIDDNVSEIRNPRLKRVKKSRLNVQASPRMALSEDNETDSHKMLNKFQISPQIEQMNNFIIHPKVIRRTSDDKLCSRRTIQSGNTNTENLIFQIPKLTISNHNNFYSNSHFKPKQDSGFFKKSQFLSGANYKDISESSFMSSLKRPFNEVQNSLFEKVSQYEEPKSDKGHAAKHIYSIMKNMSKIIYDRTLRRDKKRLRRDIESCLAEVDIQMSHLINLKNLLSKFMKEEPITSEDMKLSNLEIILFCLFLVKKRFLDLEALRWTPECLNQFRNQEMLKRSEQNYKVVLKRAFKTLISTFNTENSILGANEEEFYKHYFEKVSKEFGIPIDSFKPQKIFNEIKSTKKNGKLEKRKSKKEFASMLKKSTEFMNLLQNYLNDDLVIGGKEEGIFRDCMKELDRKLPLMIFNWQKRLGNEKNFRDEFVQFLVETLVNDKVKLPWSASEVRRGVSSVLRLFRKA
jgi:hypothetical protein